MRELLIILVLLPGLCVGQQNLVPNASFEEYSECPSTSSPWPINYWSRIYLTPDYYHFCGESLPVSAPINLRGKQSPLDGEAYVGVWAFSQLHPEAREYIIAELHQPLVTNVRYLVSFYISLAEDYGGYAVSTMGAALTAQPPSVISDNGLLYAEPQVLNNPLITLNDTTNWVLIRDTVVSRGDGERYLTIGNFHSDTESDTVLFNPDADVWQVSYYYIDDVSVIALDSVPNSLAELEEEDNGFLIYPNPSNGQMTLIYELDEGQTGTVEILDLTGRRVFNDQLETSGQMDITAQHLSAGVYTLSVVVNNEIKLSEKISILK